MKPERLYFISSKNYGCVIVHVSVLTTFHYNENSNELSHGFTLFQVFVMMKVFIGRQDCLLIFLTIQIGLKFDQSRINWDYNVTLKALRYIFDSSLIWVITHKRTSMDLTGLSLKGMTFIFKKSIIHKKNDNNEMQTATVLTWSINHVLVSIRLVINVLRRINWKIIFMFMPQFYKTWNIQAH